MFEWIICPKGPWIALGTLVALGIVWAIDNIIFISFWSVVLPPEKRRLAGASWVSAFAMTDAPGVCFPGVESSAW